MLFELKYCTKLHRITYFTDKLNFIEYFSLHINSNIKYIEVLTKIFHIIT